MNWDNISAGAFASLIAVAMLEGVLLPLYRRWRLRTVKGTYNVYRKNGKAFQNNAGDINYVKVKVVGWFSVKVEIEGRDYDTDRRWNATAYFDVPNVHGYCYYAYGNEPDGGYMELFALDGGTWAAKTHPYHSNEVAIFHWKHQGK